MPSIYDSSVRSVFPQPVQFSPDFSFMDKMLQRREALYEKGFAQLAGKWQHIAREVTNSKNAEVRDKFLREAKENLKNLSSMDLAEFSNVEAASQVFTPFVRNSNVIGDQELTQHWNSQENVAESYRLKDGGKEFSEDNINYVRMQRNAFAGSDPSEWKSYYNQKRSYNPYYDYSKEVAEKMEKFKPSSYKFDRPNGYYIVTEEDAGAKAADIKRYLNATLSDKAKQQMKIESTVRIASNPNLVLQSYQQAANREIKMNDHNISVLDKKISTSSDPAKIQKYKQEKNSLLDENKQILTNIEKIKKGDTKGVDIDGLAYSLYFNSKVENYANGYSYDKISKTLKADQVKLAFMAQDRQDARQQRGFAHQEKMMMMRAALGKKKSVDDLGFEKGVAPGTDPALVKGNVEGAAIQNQKLLNEASNIEMQMKQYIFDQIRGNSSFKDKPKSVNEINQQYIAQLLQRKDPASAVLRSGVRNYLNQLTATNASIEENNNYINSIYTKATQGFSDQDKKSLEKVYQNIAGIGNIKLDDGKTISSTELFEGISNGSIKVDESYTSGEVTFNINGKKYNAISGKRGMFGIGIYTQENVSLLTAYNKIKNERGSDVYERYSNNLEKVAKSEDMTQFAGIIKYNKDAKPVKEITGVIETAFDPKYKATVQLTGIGSTQGNQGDVYVQIAGENLNDKDIEATLQSNFNFQGANRIRKISTEGGQHTYVISGMNHYLASSMRTATELEKTITRTLTFANPTPGNPYVTVPFKVGDFDYVISKQADRNYYLYCTDLGTNSPIAQSDNATDLFVKARLFDKSSIERFGELTGQSLYDEVESDDYDLPQEEE